MLEYRNKVKSIVPNQNYKNFIWTFWVNNFCRSTFSLYYMGFMNQLIKNTTGGGTFLQRMEVPGPGIKTSHSCFNARSNPCLHSDPTYCRDSTRSLTCCTIVGSPQDSWIYGLTDFWMNLSYQLFKNYWPITSLLLPELLIKCILDYFTLSSYLLTTLSYCPSF